MAKVKNWEFGKNFSANKSWKLMLWPLETRRLKSEVKDRQQRYQEHEAKKKTIEVKTDFRDFKETQAWDKDKNIRFIFVFELFTLL